VPSELLLRNTDNSPRKIRFSSRAAVANGNGGVRAWCRQDPHVILHEDWHRD